MGSTIAQLAAQNAPDSMSSLTLFGYWHDPAEPAVGGATETTGLRGLATQAELASHYAEEMGVALDEVDEALGQDMLSELDHSGKDIGEILADFQVVRHKDDLWPIIASGVTPRDSRTRAVPTSTA